MTGNDRYWPQGFANELISELVAAAEGDSDREVEFAKLEEMCRRAAVEETAELIADPRRALIEEAGQWAAFEARLDARWGRGLDLAELVVREAYEAGRWVDDLLRSQAAARQDQKLEVLIRLHGKAVMTAREVLILLRSGYSSGAFARWRTMHEVQVVLMVLDGGDEELVRRYLAHEAVESLKAQREYEEAWETLGHEPPDWTAGEREQMQAELIDEFGRAIWQDYGWAAPLFDGKAPKFWQLEQSVELEPMRGLYRLSSLGVHATAKGIIWNIQSFADFDAVWAGPSNVGLVEPAQCSLIALAGATDILMAQAIDELADSDEPADSTIKWLLDRSLILVRRRVIDLLVDHAIQTLVEVDAQQEAEEEARAELVSRASAVLQEDVRMTAAELSTELEVDPDALADALDAAAARGELLSEIRYRRGTAD